MSKKVVKGEYIETDTGNKVSRRSQIIGTQNIILGGKTVIQSEVIIRGDLLRTPPPPGGPTSGTTDKDKGASVAVAIGRYGFLGKGCCLRPPGRIHRGHFSHYPLKLGDHVYIGPGATVEAALIGSYVHVGAGAVVGKFAIVKDYVRVLAGAVLPPHCVVPSFSVVAGRPARVVAELQEGEVDEFDLRDLYRTIVN